MQFISRVANKVSTEWLAFAVIMFGCALFFQGWKKSNLSIIGTNNSINNPRHTATVGCSMMCDNISYDLIASKN